MEKAPEVIRFATANRINSPALSDNFSIYDKSIISVSVCFTDTYYLSCGYMITCCGVLNEWRYDPDITNVEVELHVWRLITGSNYRLISTTTHTATSSNKTSHRYELYFIILQCYFKPCLYI